jgi:hypothetical protein
MRAHAKPSSSHPLPPFRPPPEPPRVLAALGRSPAEAQAICPKAIAAHPRPAPLKPTPATEAPPDPGAQRQGSRCASLRSAARQVARGEDNYYSGRGEAPGEWVGAGSRRPTATA